MNIWLITDTHFNHKKVIEYCDRPLDYEKKLWSGMEAVPESDLLIHLGDICIGGDREVHERIKKLKCRTALVMGNHDKQSPHWYMSNGWDIAVESTRLEWGGKHIVLSHIPLPRGEADFNIHGHFHNKVHRVEESHAFYKPEYHLRLACEMTDYKPVTLENIVTHPAKYRIQL